MTPCFELTNICFNYPGYPQALNGVNLRLDPGERLFLHGGNGAGKSTLLHIMLGLLRPNSGEVIAFGQPRRDETDFQEVRRRAGLVFQDVNDQLFCPTVLQDVAFGPLNLGKSREEALQIVETVLKQLGIEDFRDRITHKLSGGEKRLVTLAAVLAMEPEVLLLDEPTTALDESACQRLEDILLSLPQTMVIISHDQGFRERMATRILQMRQGRLQAAVLD